MSSTMLAVIPARCLHPAAHTVLDPRRWSTDVGDRRRRAGSVPVRAQTPAARGRLAEHRQASGTEEVARRQHGVAV